MKGDFTRGHNPDLQRAKRYRRVLLQQGRVLLDSDHAAAIGAMDRNLRELGQDLGCAAGGSDYGFLVTPGKLYALFDELDHIRANQNVKLGRDYRLKLLDRYPSLHVQNTAAQADVEIELFTPHGGGDLTLWCRGEVATDFVIEDVPQTISIPVVAPAGELAPVTVDLPATTSVRIRIDSVDPQHVWIAMIESREDAAEPSFWLAPGRFHFGGLIFENPEPTSWPQQAFPAEVGFSVTTVSDFAGAGGFFVAYIEGWERLHTHLHDRGIREEALGGLDTTVRTEAVGQVKVMWVDEQPDLLALRTALARPVVGDGTLAVSVAAAIDDPDPCALPIEGGYSGPDNRLYHFEVHVGGPLGVARFKWSRDNGSELYSVVALTGTIVHVAPGSGLQDGDLVELVSDLVELGDAVGAVFEDDAFTPAVRNVGQLALLQRDGDGVDDLGRETFKLIALDSGAPLDPDPAFYPDDQRMLLRRWHGQFTTPDDAETPVELEHGIKLAFDGTRFVVGDWWEWQARVLLDNDNGEFQTSPHGPERLFAPLAVLENSADPEMPLRLRAWADDRFVGLCDLDADHVPFDGKAFTSNARTVQEALDELYDFTGFFHATNCCGLEFRPDPNAQVSDDVRLAQLLIDALPNGGTVCLEKGIYVFAGTVDLGDLAGNLTIKASNDVVIVQTTAAPLFRVPTARVLQLEGALLFSGADLLNPQLEPICQVRLDGHRAVFDARGCMFLMLGTGAGVIYDGGAVVTPPPIGGVLQSIIGKSPLPEPNADVLMRDCVVIASRGIRCATLNRLLLDRVTISAVVDAVAVQRIGQLEARHSTLTGLLPLNDDALDLMTPNTVLGYRYVLANFAQDVGEANLGNVNAGSFALRTQFIDGGTMTDCRLAAETGIFVDALSRVRISDSWVHAAHAAVWVNQAEEAVFRGLSVVATGADENGISIHVYARDTAIEQCEVEAVHGGGILVGGQDPQPNHEIDVAGLRIVDNQVRAMGAGIIVGPRDGAQPGNIVGVLIGGNKATLSENSETKTVIGLFRHIGASSDQGALVSGNITFGGRVAIRTTGPRISIIGNDATLHEIGTGVRVIAGFNSVIRDNTINCRSPETDDSMTGINISDTERVSISGNSVLADPADIHLTRPLLVDACAQVSISANSFRSGTCRVNSCNDVQCEDNRFERGLDVQQCVDGSMIGNRVEGTFSVDGIQPPLESLLAHEVWGTWNVANNSVVGTIRVIPRGTLVIIQGEQQQAELPYNAMISGNRAGRVQAGYRNMQGGEVAPFETTSRLPATSSVVMVMGNFCLERIIINDYQHLVVVNNATPILAGIGLPALDAKISAPNIFV